MTRRIAGLPWPSLTRAFTPGTRRPLQPWQVNLLNEWSRRTLKRSFTFLASAACSLARSGLVWERLTADSVRNATKAAASSFAPLRAFMGPSPLRKDLTVIVVPGLALLNFVLAESALELVPKEINGRPAVVSDSKRRGMKASDILLDRSFHHSAMSRLKDSEKRGRPDLVHVALLSVTGTPLYLDGRVRVFVQTYPGLVLELAERTRIPKNYLRFRGLMEKALVERPGGGLVRTYSAGVNELVRKKLGCDFVLGLSVQGRQSDAGEVAKRLASAKNPCVIIGGFPHGHFSKEVLAPVDELDRIDSRPLEAHVVASRVVYEVEKTVRGINN